MGEMSPSPVEFGFQGALKVQPDLKNELLFTMSILIYPHIDDEIITYCYYY